MFCLTLVFYKDVHVQILAWTVNVHHWPKLSRLVVLLALSRLFMLMSASCRRSEATRFK